MEITIQVGIEFAGAVIGLIDSLLEANDDPNPILRGIAIVKAEDLRVVTDALTVGLQARDLPAAP